MMHSVPTSINAATVTTFRPLATFIPDDWSHATLTTSNAVTIHYWRTGNTQKPPIILLHGLQQDGLTWLRSALTLATNYNIIMPDLRGHGASNGVNQGIAIDQLAQDVLYLINMLALADPILIGHSMGANVAGYVASQYPLRALVLVDPPLYNVAMQMPAIDPDAPPSWLAPIFAARHALRTQTHAEKMLTGLKLLPPSIGYWHEIDYVSFVEAQPRFDNNFFRYIAQMENLVAMPLILSAIQCPTLLLTAPSYHPEANGLTLKGVTTLKQQINQLKHIHLEDSDHFIHFAHFERWLGIIRQFFEAQ